MPAVEMTGDRFNQDRKRRDAPQTAGLPHCRERRNLTFHLVA